MYYCWALIDLRCRFGSWAKPMCILHVSPRQVKRDFWLERSLRGLPSLGTPATSNRPRRRGFATCWKKATCTSTPEICFGLTRKTLSTFRIESATRSGESWLILCRSVSFCWFNFFHRSNIECVHACRTEYAETFKLSFGFMCKSVPS